MASHAYNVAYYIANREKVLAQVSANYAAHRDKILAYKAAYYAEHRESLAAQHATYYAAHREEGRARSAATRGTAAGLLSQVKSNSKRRKG